MVTHHQICREIDVIPDLMHIQREIRILHGLEIRAVEALDEALSVLLDHGAGVMDVFVAVADEHHFLVDSSRVLELHDIALVSTASHSVVSEHLGEGVAQSVECFCVGGEEMRGLGFSQLCSVCDDTFEVVSLVVVFELSQVARVRLIHVLHRYGELAALDSEKVDFHEGGLDGVFFAT